MFEWHGWVTVVASAAADDDPGVAERDAATRNAVAGVIARFDREPAFETYDLRQHNGQNHVWLSGYRNHRQDRIVELYREIARAAPGSYGVMYVYDDERPGAAGNAWQRWVMRRGTVSLEDDSSLTPHVGLVEDRYRWEDQEQEQLDDPHAAGPLADDAG